MNVLASQHHTHAGITQKSIKYKIYHTLPWWLNTAVTCTMVWKGKPCVCDNGFERSDLCAEIIIIIIIIMYQSGRLSSKKIPCITVGAEYNGSMYQSGRLPSKKYRALPWGLSIPR